MANRGEEKLNVKTAEEMNGEEPLPDVHVNSPPPVRRPTLRTPEKEHEKTPVRRSQRKRKPVAVPLSAPPARRAPSNKKPRKSAPASAPRSTPKRKASASTPIDNLRVFTRFCKQGQQKMNTGSSRKKNKIIRVN